MTAMGETLRRERLKRNLDYGAVSKELKISPRLLQAIEEEQVAKLPGGVFIKSFVRQYAHLLGVDEEEAVAAFQHLTQAASAPAFATASPAHRPEPQFELKPTAKPIDVPPMGRWDSIADRRHMGESSTLTALALVVGVMLVCSLVYGWWQRDRRPGARPPATVSAAQPSQARAAATQPRQTASAPAAEQSGSPAATVSRAPDTPAPARATATGSVHLELTATEPVWVSASADGKVAFSGIIQADQTKTLDASEAAEVKVGNAAGLKISLNDKPIGDIGGHGEVRTIQFTPGGFKIVAPKPSPMLFDPIGFL